MPRSITCWSWLLPLGLTALLGCGPASQTPTQDPPRAEAPAGETPDSESPGSETPGGETGETTPGSETPGSESPGSETPAPEPETPAETPAAASNQVKLGDPSLTAGIPGEGPLTLEQIKDWLAREENHVPLEVTLPMGLDAGAANLFIPEDNPLTRAKIELGRQLYFDGRLSSTGAVSCAECHHPEEGYARKTQFGVGIEGLTGNRNSPASYNRILSKEQFWDGRAATLEDQAIGPIANPIEMGNTHESCIECLKGIEGYKLQFEKIFEDGLTIENVGRAIASFERAIVTGPSPYDYYEPLRVLRETFKQDLEDLDLLREEDPELYEEYMRAVKASEAHPISEAAIRGRDLFFAQKSGCTACHTGANFTDEKYHNLGVGMEADEPDLGRYEVTKEEKDRGAFKTPTIRNVALTPPYMHDGSQATLLEVVEWYDRGGHPNPHLSENIRKLELTEQEKLDLVAFMEALTGPFPEVEMGRLPE